MPAIVDVDVVCPCCQTPIATGSPTVTCEQCHRVHHARCWERHCGCGVSGCGAQPSSILGSPAEDLTPLQEDLALEVPRRPWLEGRGTLLWGIFTAVAILAVAIIVIRPSSPTGWILAAVVVAALGFDFVNGMNDSANAIATVVSTRVLTPLAAVIMAALLNFGGAVVFEGVAKTIAGKIVDPTAVEVTMVMILCGLIGAVAWSWFMTAYGLPISLSHSLIGGLIGVLLIANAPLETDSIAQIFIWMVIAPIIGFGAGFGLMLLLLWLFHKAAPHRINRHFRFWQIISSASMAFSHGANDAQKAMGIITLALVAAGVHAVGPDGVHIPLWVKIACASVIAIGTGLGGWKVIRTLGHRMIRLTPVHGFAAETAAAGAISLATILHMPVSTTHVISASILGVGASQRLSAVRWGVAGNIVLAWVFTIPACGGVAALLYYLAKLLGWH